MDSGSGERLSVPNPNPPDPMRKVEHRLAQAKPVDKVYPSGLVPSGLSFFQKRGKAFAAFPGHPDAGDAGCRFRNQCVIHGAARHKGDQIFASAAASGPFEHMA